MKCLPKRKGEWVLVSAHLPGRSPEPIGILLSDAGELHSRFRNDWSRIVSDTDEIEIWRELANDLQQRGCEHGASWVLHFLEDAASHALQIGARQTIELTNVQRTLEKLYQKYVAKPREQVRYCDSTFYRVCAAAAAIIVLATLVGKHHHTGSGRTPLFDSTRYHLGPLPLLRHSLPTILELSPDGLRNPSFRRERSLRSRIAITSREHRQFRFNSVVFHHPEHPAFTIDAPPLLLDIPQPDPDAVLLCFSLPEPPDFHSHRSRLVQVLAAVALPFKWLFVHREQTSNSL